MMQSALLSRHVYQILFFVGGGVDHGGTSSFRGDQGDQEKSGKKNVKIQKIDVKVYFFFNKFPSLLAFIAHFKGVKIEAEFFGGP